MYSYKQCANGRVPLNNWVTDMLVILEVKVIKRLK